MLQWIRQFFAAEIEVYTDGGCKNGTGSWAYVIVKKGQAVTESSGIVRKTNSNEMEFLAVVEALRAFDGSAKILFWTDSRILISALHAKIPIGPWSSHANEIKALSLRHKVRFNWVRAHSGNKFNERCDQLCVIARSTAKGPSENSSKMPANLNSSRELFRRHR